MFSQILRDVGLRKVSEVTGRTLRQVYKWEVLNTLPRSDFTGETFLARAIAEASGGLYSEQEVLAAAIEGAASPLRGHDMSPEDFIRKHITAALMAEGFSESAAGG